MTTLGDVNALVSTGMTLSLAYTILQAIDNFWLLGLERKIRALEAEKEYAKWDEDVADRFLTAKLSVRKAVAEADSKGFTFFQIAIFHTVIMAAMTIIFVFLTETPVDPYVVLFVLFVAYGPPIVVPICQYIALRPVIETAQAAIGKVTPRQNHNHIGH